MSTPVIVGLVTGLFLLLVGGFLLRSALRPVEENTLPVDEIGERARDGVRLAYSRRPPADGYGPPPRIAPVPVGDDTRNLKFPGRIYDGRQQT